MAAAPSNPGLAKQFMYKNQLQEHAQKSAIPMPVYHTVNERYSHAPQFRSTVTVDGVTYRSYRTFAHRKEAEQDVAKLALEGLSRKIEREGVSLIHEDKIAVQDKLCKSILYEYAVKMNIGNLTYSCSQLEGKIPSFVSSLVFDGKTYTGCAANNKKEAEQMAARTVIQSILASSDTRTAMSQIIKSKGSLPEVLHKGSFSGTSQDPNLGIGMPAENIPSNHKGKEVHAYLANYNLPSYSYPEAVQITNATETLSFSQAAKIPKQEYVCEPTHGTIGHNKLTPTLPKGDLSSIGVFNSTDGNPLVSSAMQHSDSQRLVLDSGRKRSNNNQGGCQSKKTRPDECQWMTPAPSHGTLCASLVEEEVHAQ